MSKRKQTAAEAAGESWEQRVARLERELVSANRLSADLVIQRVDLRQALRRAHEQIDLERSLTAAAQKRAERYRWLRIQPWMYDEETSPVDWHGSQTPEQLDEAIDAAMKEGK